MAAFASAVLNPNDDANPALLSTRQTCTYSCGCQEQGGGGGVDPDTAKCCIGGTLGNEGTLCTDMDFATAQAYGRCCGSSGGYVCFQSAPSCPPVTL
ncbi:hypothetical protein VTI28DRAFT_5947 [Corynascus sepedonium]